jgi:geranylgeranyl reductase family protein
VQTRDVVIVGGGPAGSSCAARLRAAGLDVIVLDKAAFPRTKPCAGWITPAVVEALALDVEEYRRGRTFQAITRFRTGRIGGPGVEIRYGRTVSFAVRRTEFDAYLLRRSGACVRTGTPVLRLRGRGGDWIVDGAIRTPIVVGAGGHFCPVARFLNGVAAPEAVVVAQEMEFRLRERDPGRVEGEVPELYFSADLRGYGWCGRKGDYLTVGLGRRDPHRLAAHVREFLSYLRREDRIPRELPSRWHGHAYLLYERTARRLFDDGVLLVGDAAGLASSASGEGIRPAVESGLLAAETLVAAGGRFDRDRLAPYQEALEARLGPRRRRKALPPRLAVRLSGPLLGSRWFARHVLLDRYFLRAREPALRLPQREQSPGGVGPDAKSTGGRRPCPSRGGLDHLIYCLFPSPAQTGRPRGLRTAAGKKEVP